jgi:hypothetical protein
MSGDQYSTRLDGKERRIIERYRDAKNVSKAEALRRAVHRLDRDRDDDQSPELSSRIAQTQDGIRTWGALIAAGLSFLLVAQTGALPDILVAILGTVLLAGIGFAWYQSLDHEK